MSGTGIEKKSMNATESLEKQAVVSAPCACSAKAWRAISLWQPWASAMAAGMKKNETRSWPTAYRGELAICAAKRNLDHDGLAVARNEGVPLTGMAFGAVLCVVEVYACLPTNSAHIGQPITEQEMALGDYSPGRFFWMTRNCRTLTTPLPIVGRQGMWILTPETVAQIKALLPNAPDQRPGAKT